MSTRYSFGAAWGRIRVNDERIGAFPHVRDFLPLQAADEPVGVPSDLHLWNPPHCGDSRMRIARDGTWYHEGAPIRRPGLVRLFSSILRRDPDGFVLVTPAEKLSIVVDDVPFLAIEMGVLAERHPVLSFRTNVGEVVAAGEAHPLRFHVDEQGGLRPYVLVRSGLWARLTRPVTYELLSRAEERPAGASGLGVASGATFFAIPDGAGA